MEGVRILLIGGLPPPLGGTTVSFRQLTAEIERIPDVQSEVIDTSRRGPARPWSALATGLRVAWRSIRATRRSDVVTFHASTPGTLRFGPIVYGLSRLLRTPMVLREFGGSFDQDYEAMSAPVRWAIRRVLRAERVLFQTRNLVEHFRRTVPEGSFDWYPNSRPLGAEEPPVDCGVRKPARRFAFVGHVQPTKGLREIFDAARSLEVDCSVDVYGPLLEGISERDFERSEKVAYRGVLPPDAVIATLQGYDAVLLPTYHFGEGYPGIVLEAYAAGRPVIATRWRSIPEVVEDGVSGLLVEPRDADDLARAMRSLCEDGEKMRHLAEGARRAAKRFASTRWTKEFVSICRTVAAEHARTRG
jgi:glycosyltransferase involved in cell wall biosynthesis